MGVVKMKSFGLLLCLFALSANAVPQRNSRQLSLGIFNIVSFANDQCNAENGDLGTCRTDAECAETGGMKSGVCAAGFGACCVYAQTLATEGEATITQNCSYIQNEGLPKMLTLAATTAVPSPMFTNSYTLARKVNDEDICSIRLDFVKTLTMDVTKDCATDNFKIGVAPSNQVTLCGVLTGQHMYIDQSSTGTLPTFDVSFMGVGMRDFKVMVTFYEGVVPAPAVAFSLDAAATAIADQAKIDSNCGSDYVGIISEQGPTRFCGLNLNNVNDNTVNALITTKQFRITTTSDAINPTGAIQESGYVLNWNQLPC